MISYGFKGGSGIAFGGGRGDRWSGDIFLASSSTQRLPGCNLTWPGGTYEPGHGSLQQPHRPARFEAVAEATQEAILNAQLAAATMVGRDGVTAHALDPEQLVSVLQRCNRLSCAGMPA